MTFNDYAELKTAQPALAKELLDYLGEGDWQDEPVYVHDNLTDYAKYEVTDGWYSGLGMGDMDTNGAPNPLDFIDYDKLGQALADGWDDSCHYLSDSGLVVEFG